MLPYDLVSRIASHEAALVKAARAMGYVFTTRTPTGVSIKLGDLELHYEVLQVLEFTSFRKRMGVVVREPSGRILVMVKGAVRQSFISVWRWCSLEYPFILVVSLTPKHLIINGKLCVAAIHAALMAFNC
ncbi:unnamed protein product [Echinostoma caproni]|uniref:THUMP domain-containing protein n=1 Tax=Echinostoma caproni TaxID=27848 RepID=A0A183B7R2_9TREM|nr:unnamed protein product [Echinostoma caproni]